MYEIHNIYLWVCFSIAVHHDHTYNGPRSEETRTVQSTDHDYEIPHRPPGSIEETIMLDHPYSEGLDCSEDEIITYRPIETKYCKQFVKKLFFFSID